MASTVTRSSRVTTGGSPCISSSGVRFWQVHAFRLSCSAREGAREGEPEMARACKQCGQPYGILAAGGDGLCKTCRGKEAADKKTREEEKQKKELELALSRLPLLANEIVGGSDVKAFGLAMWDTLASRFEKTVHLWIGRFLFGILGDIVHVDTHLLGMIVVSSGEIRIARLGQGSTFEPPAVLAAAVNSKHVMRATLSEVQCTLKGNMLNIRMPKRRIRAKFPPCFFPGNELAAHQIASAVVGRRS